ncbi:MAG: carboxypeptidase-like regulatory domain-containing protein, partial [Dokdonella sp.]|uniref:carboxypeptidase-like regulatory domain-containing protein n=1 Tax=Dokdonella sp. TaxID=2291710 RepID=UPI003267DECA
MSGSRIAAQSLTVFSGLLLFASSHANTISGRVTAISSGAPIFQAHVNLLRNDVVVVSSQTASDGRYSLEYENPTAGDAFSVDAGAFLFLDESQAIDPSQASIHFD